MQRRAERKLGRALFALTIAGTCAWACDDPKAKDDPGEEVQEAARALERTVERSGQAIRERTQDGSLLIETPGKPAKDASPER